MADSIPVETLSNQWPGLKPFSKSVWVEVDQRRQKGLERMGGLEVNF
jgi:hypothetical protein